MALARKTRIHYACITKQIADKTCITSTGYTAIRSALRMHEARFVQSYAIEPHREVLQITVTNVPQRVCGHMLKPC